MLKQLTNQLTLQTTANFSSSAGFPKTMLSTFWGLMRLNVTSILMTHTSMTSSVGTLACSTAVLSCRPTTRQYLMLVQYIARTHYLHLTDITDLNVSCQDSQVVVRLDGLQLCSVGTSRGEISSTQDRLITIATLVRYQERAQTPQL